MIFSEILMDALKISSKEEDLQNKSQIIKALYILLLDKRYDPKLKGISPKNM